MIARATLSLILLISHAAGAEPASSRPASTPAGESFTLLYTGRTGGLGSHSSSGISVLLVWQSVIERRGTATFEATGHGVLHRGGRFLIDERELRAASLLRLLRGGARREVVSERLAYLETDHVILFQAPADPELDLLALAEERNRRTRMDPSLRRGQARLVRHRAASGETALALELPGCAASPLERDAAAWDPLGGVRGHVQLAGRGATYFMVFKPRGLGARRVRFLEEERRRLGAASALLVSAGDELGTFDSLRGGRSRLRDLDAEVLGRLRYDAIAPGPRELYYGASDLLALQRRHRLPLVATNLYRKGPSGLKAPFLPRYLLRRIAGVRVALLGVVGNDLAERVRDPEVVADLEVRDPAEEVNHVVDQLQRLPGGRPELVVVAGRLAASERASFLADVHGVDVVIGDFDRALLRPASETVDLRPRALEVHLLRGPALVPRSDRTVVGIVEVSLEPGRGGLHAAELRHRPRPITFALPADEALRRRVVALGLQDYEALEARLIPAIEEVIGDDAALRRRVLADPEFTREFAAEETEKWQLWYTPRLWAGLLANLLRAAAAAEVAMVRVPLGLGYNGPGPILEGYVLSWLPHEDAVRQVELTGATLRQLATADLEGIALTGLDVGTLRVGGRPLRDNERYRVVLDTAVAANPAVARALRGVELQREFELRGTRLRARRGGRSVQLREVALAVLRDQRRRDPAFGAATRARLRSWLTPKGTELDPRWSFAVEGLSLSFASYANYPSTSWLRHPGVRETRAVMPANYTIQSKGTLAAVYDGIGLAWDTRVLFDLARTVVSLDELPGKAPIVVKNADDLQLSTELRLKLIELALGAAGRVSLVPYANATFDTEFTPTQNQLTGEDYPHQKDLSGSLGLVSYPGRYLTELRLAGVLRADLAASRGKLDGGLLVGAKLELPLWLARLELGGTLRYFFDTPEDTVEKLGLILQSTAKLKVPFTRDLSVFLAADLFLFRPKLLTGTDLATNQPVPRGTSASLILSAGLSFDHLFKL